MKYGIPENETKGGHNRETRQQPGQKQNEWKS